MLADLLGLTSSIADLAAVCGTTSAQGTDVEGMCRGLAALGLRYAVGPRQAIEMRPSRPWRGRSQGQLGEIEAETLAVAAQV